MKLTSKEIDEAMTQAIKEIAASQGDLTNMPEAKEFADQITENKSVKLHVLAVQAMEGYAMKLGIPPEAATMASLISGMWLGYKLHEAEDAKSQVADLERMAKQ